MRGTQSNELRVAIHDIVDDERDVLKSMVGLSNILRHLGNRETYSPRDMSNFCLHIADTIDRWRRDLEGQNSRLWNEYKSASSVRDTTRG